MANTVGKFSVDFGLNGSVKTNRNVVIGSIDDSTPGNIQTMRKQMFFYEIADKQSKIFEVGSMPFAIEEGTFSVIIPTTVLNGSDTGLWNTMKGADVIRLKQMSEYISITSVRGYKAIYDSLNADYLQDPSAISRITDFVNKFAINRDEDQITFGDISFSTQKARDGQFNKMNFDLNLSNKYNMIDLNKAYPFFIPLDLKSDGLNVPGYSNAKSIDDLGNPNIVSGDNIDKRNSIGSALAFDNSKMSKLNISGVTFGIRSLLLSKQEKMGSGSKNGVLFVTQNIFHQLVTGAGDNIQKSLFLNNPYAKKQTSLVYGLEDYQIEQNSEVIENVNGFEIIPFVINRNVGGYRLSSPAESNLEVGGKVIPTAWLSMFYVLNTEGVASFTLDESLIIVPPTANAMNNLETLKYRKVGINAVSALSASNIVPVYELSGAFKSSLISISDSNGGKLIPSNLSLKSDQAIKLSANALGLNLTSGIGKGYFAIEVLPATEGYEASANPSSLTNLKGNPLRAQLIIPNAKTIADITNYPFKSALASGKEIVALPAAAASSIDASIVALAGNKETNLQIRVTQYDSLTASAPSILLTNTVLV